MLGKLPMFAPKPQCENSALLQQVLIETRELNLRLIRIETRQVKLFNHMGINPSKEQK